TGTNLAFSTSISPNTNWLSVSGVSPFLSGTTPSNVQLSIDPTGLGPGPYQGSVLITSAAAANNPLSVPVTLNVLPGPVLSAQPQQLNFGLTQGGTTTASNTLTISTDVPFSFTAAAQTASDGNWLTVDPQGAQASTALTVSVSAAGLAPGTYGGTILVTSAQVTNSPLAIPVILTVSMLPQFTVVPS